MTDAPEPRWSRTQELRWQRTPYRDIDSAQPRYRLVLEQKWVDHASDRFEWRPVPIND